MSTPAPPVKDCPFCQANWRNLDIVDRNSTGSIIAITPLNPVTDGHVLVIHHNHYESAAASPDQAANLMMFAAKYIAKNGIEANIITSIGPAATQTVRHTHVHVVPRTEGDGLRLPWTNQHKHAEINGAVPAGSFVKASEQLTQTKATTQGSAADVDAAKKRMETARDGMKKSVAKKAERKDETREISKLPDVIEAGTVIDAELVEPAPEPPKPKVSVAEVERIAREEARKNKPEPVAPPPPSPPIEYLGKGGQVIGTTAK